MVSWVFRGSFHKEAQEDQSTTLRTGSTYGGIQHCRKLRRFEGLRLGWIQGLIREGRISTEGFSTLVHFQHTEMENTLGEK